MSDEGIAGSFSSKEASGFPFMPSQSLTDFMNSRYRDYALYVLYSRAIPSVIDGLKPSQRKVLWTADRIARSKMVKTAALAGAVTESANYHHGSTEGVASLMAGTHCNNVPLLDGVQGNFGSRLVPAYSAPRYTFVKISKDFDRYFADDLILESSEDPEDPEPKYYLPLIPWVLVNGVEGIAIGFATEIQPRDPKVLSAICRDYITGKKTREQVLAMDIPPYFEGFNGEIFKRDHVWACRGNWNRKSAHKIEVTELPIGTVRLKYIEFLNKLKEQNKIASYDEGKAEDGRFKVTIRFPSDVDLDALDVNKFLRLEKALSENITTIDENLRLKIFESAAELLVHFCDFRLKKYAERFGAWIKRDEAEVYRLGAKISFIKAVLDKKIEFTGQKKVDLAEQIWSYFKEKLGWTLSKEDENMLLNVRTYEFSSDEIDELEEKKGQLEFDIIKWKDADHREWYAKELKEIMK